MSEELNLLQDFPKVSTKQWKEKIITDLKGADFDKKLVWKTDEGFSIQPFYRAEDIKGLKTPLCAPGQYPFVRGTRENNNWYIRQNLCIRSPREAKKANATALALLTKGITSLGFNIAVEKLNYNLIKNLLEGINPEEVALNFQVPGCQAVDLAGFLVRYFKHLKLDLKKIHGSIDLDPIRNMLLRGNKFEVEKITERMVAIANKLKSLPHFKGVCVNSVILNNAGAYCVSELAYALAWGAQYLTLMTEAGVPSHIAAKTIRFNMGIGGNYFMEIAKFRAGRLLWAKIVEAYKNPTFSKPLKEASKMEVSATTSRFNMTIFDAYVNLLRSQTETMSAVIAGVDEVTVTPFDVTYEKPSEFAERIAKNQQLLLKEEAHFDKIVDPAAGSYYIETLTEAIIENAWKEFLAIQDKGGVYQMVITNQLQDAISANLTERLGKVAKRRETILGSNQFPNFTEKAGKKIKSCEDKICFCAAKNPEVVLHTLPVARAAQEFEELRLATEGASKQPVVFMLTIGNLAMRIARAQFSCNFFACAGYKVVDNNGFKTVADGLKAAKRAKADIVVLCSSDDEYAELAPQAWKAINEGEYKPLFVVAGAPACMEDLQKVGIQNFVHVRCNVLDTLKSFNAQLLNK